MLSKIVKRILADIGIAFGRVPYTTIISERGETMIQTVIPKGWYKIAINCEYIRTKDLYSQFQFIDNTFFSLSMFKTRRFKNTTHLNKTGWLFFSQEIGKHIEILRKDELKTVVNEWAIVPYVDSFYVHKKHKGIYLADNDIFYHPSYKDEVDEILKDLVKKANPKVSLSSELRYGFFISAGTNMYIDKKIVNLEHYKAEDFNINYSKRQMNTAESIISNILNQDKGLYILYGPPGCGKTALITYINRTIYANEQNTDFLIVPPSVMLNMGESLFATIIDKYKESDAPLVIIFEDSEQLVKKYDVRTMAQTALLSWTDGTYGLSLQRPLHIILSFNEEPNSIPFRQREDLDSAVIRVGRLTNHMACYPMNPDQADIWCEKKGIPPLGEEITLAELYDYYKRSFKSARNNPLEESL